MASPVDELFKDPEWYDIPMGRAIENLAIVREQEVASIVRMVFKDATSGGLEFKDGKDTDGGAYGDKLEPADHKKEKQIRDRTAVYLPWLFEAFEHYVANGYPVCGGIPNPTPTAHMPFVPIVWDLKQVRQRYRRFVNSATEWRMYDRTKHNTMTPGSHTEETEIKEFTVLGNSADMPSSGKPEFNSIIEALRRDIDVYTDKINNTRIADRRRAEPSGFILTEEKEIKHDDLNVHKPVKVVDATSHRASMTDSGLDSAPDTVDRARLIHLVNCHGPGSQEVSDAITHRAHEVSLLKRYRTSNERIRTLGSGQSYMAEQMAEAPSDTLEWANVRLQRVCLQFSLPLRSVTDGDTTSTAKLDMTKASPEQARMFRQSQKALRVMFSDWCTKIENFINTPVRTEERVLKRKTPPSDDETQELIELSSCTIVVKGSPLREVVNELYLNGSLKYSYYAQYESHEEEIPLSAFNAKPSIEIKDLAGVKPAESGSKPKKKKAKSS